jgi:hypothetical protein
LLRHIDKGRVLSTIERGSRFVLGFVCDVLFGACCGDDDENDLDEVIDLTLNEYGDM